MLNRMVMSLFIGLLWFVLAVQHAQGIEIVNIRAFDNASTSQINEFVTSNVVQLGILMDTKDENIREIKVGKQIARQDLDSKSSWVIDNYILKPGVNKISATATDKDGKTHKKDISIHYLDITVPGAKYYVENIASANRIKIFNNHLNFEIPKNTYMMWKNAPARDQSLTFQIVERPAVRPEPQYSYVSDVYLVTARSNQFSLINPGRLSLKYDSQLSNLTANNLTVFYSSLPSSPQNLRLPLARNMGGVVDTGAKTITVPFAENGFGYYVVVHAMGDFRDFEAGKTVDLQWSRPYVLTLWAKGIMTPLTAYSNGKPVEPGYFGLALADKRTETILTRSELAGMLIRGLNLESFNYPPVLTYSDLTGLPPLEVMNIERAAQLGLFSGFPASDGTLNFRPITGVTRQQAAIVLVRAANLTVPEQSQATTTLARLCPNDYHSIDQWAQPYVAAALQGGLIETAEPNHFKPENNLTRAEGAKYIYLTLNKLKKI